MIFFIFLKKVHIKEKYFYSMKFVRQTLGLIQDWISYSCKNFSAFSTGGIKFLLKKNPRVSEG